MPAAKPTPPPSDSADPWFRLDHVRRIRTRTPVTGDMSALFRSQIPEIRSAKKRLACIAGAWAQMVPAELAAQTTIRGVSRGVLSIEVADGAARYELDRFLRSGGEAALLRLMPSTVQKVRVGLGQGELGPRAGSGEGKGSETRRKGANWA